MKITYSYYAFDKVPSYDGSYGVSEYESTEYEIIESEETALAIYVACSVLDLSWLVRRWDKNKTKAYVSDNIPTCLEYIKDECGKRGNYPGDYDFDSFAEMVCEALPKSFWEYAQVSEVNPRGYSEPEGLIDYRIYE